MSQKILLAVNPKSNDGQSLLWGIAWDWDPGMCGSWML